MEGTGTRTGGQVAYEAYSLASADRSLISGDELPGWAALPEAIQGAWEAAADAVRAQQPEEALITGTGGLRLGKPGAGSPREVSDGE